MRMTVPGEGKLFVFAPAYDKTKEYVEYSLTRSKIIDRLQHDSRYDRSDALKALLDMKGDFISSMKPNLMEPTSEDDEEEYLLYNKLLIKKHARRVDKFKADMISIYEMIIHDYCSNEMEMTMMSIQSSMRGSRTTRSNY